MTSVSLKNCSQLFNYLIGSRVVSYKNEQGFSNPEWNDLKLIPNSYLTFASLTN